MRCLAALILLTASGLWAQPPTGVPNGDMEALATAGAPEAWEASGDPETVSQELASDVGREDGRSLRLTCTAFRQDNPASHAMACQVGTVAVEAGKGYRLVLWARQEGLDETPISVALVNTRGWRQLGLGSSLVAGEGWERHEFDFEATETCHETTRLQIWFLGTGTLWLDDVTLEQVDFASGPTLTWLAEGRRNLLPNAGFEVGPSGWGSVGDFGGNSWPLTLNRLVGEVVDDSPWEGSRCLRLEVTDETLPVGWFDYFAMSREPATALLTGNVGWMETVPGAEYRFSAWVRASRDDVVLRMDVHGFDAGTQSREVRCGREWTRVEMPVRAASGWCWVAIGPMLGPPHELPLTVWLDGLQLEGGDVVADFSPRDSVEAGLSTAAEGNIFPDPRQVRLALEARNPGDRPARVELTLRDWQGREAFRRAYEVPAGASAWRETVDPALTAHGLYRARLSIDGIEQPRDLRLAAIPRYASDDSLVGVNHAYPWPHLLRACVAAGILWVRDWSVKWQDVQPTEGAPFDFTETDLQIDRPVAAGQRVLALLPFPSANWSSSAPPEVAAGGGYPGVRERQAWAPRDDAEFARWVSATVEHYRGRVSWYQVFNEPIYTDYSLPREHGYTGRDYGRLVGLFAEAARAADPECRVLAGIGSWPSYAEPIFRDMFDAGGLEAADAIDLHVYPGLTPPETLEKGLKLIRSTMEERGTVKPLWLTEHGYYADDDFERLPIRDAGFNAPVPSERVQAEYAIRFDVMLLAHGCERIFYHAGTCPGLNEDNTEGVFFEYGGAPRAIYCAVAAFTDLFHPGVEPLGEWDVGRAAKAYLFRQGDELILALWSRAREGTLVVEVTDARIAARDLMGNPIEGRPLQVGSAPTFLRARGLTPEQLRAAVSIRAER